MRTIGSSYIDSISDITSPLRHIFFICCLLIFSQASLGEPQSGLFLVSTGDDPAIVSKIGKPGDSSSDTHFASLEKALEACRKSSQEAGKHIRIYGGRYFLDQTIELEKQDSGVTIEAAEGTHPVFIGGRQIENWEKDGDRFYAADAPGVKQGTWDFRALVVNGELRARARMPESGTFKHDSEFKVPWMSTTGGGWKRKPSQDELTTLKYKPEDIDTNFDVNNAEITVYHMWDESLVGVKSIDRDSHTITFSNPSGHPAGAFGVQKYVVWNTQEGMTKPGQWYLDCTRGKIVYWPLPGEDMNKIEMLAPAVESIIRIQDAQNICIQGLKFSVTTTPLQAGGFGAGRFSGAVDIRNGKNCRLRKLEICNVAGQGVRAERSQNTTIEHCDIHDTGACGIKAPGSMIQDNRVHHIGRIYPSAIGVWGGGKGCVISHNEIHHTTYSAINCGGENHRIENNRIYQAMLELHDGGAIYVFAGKNTILRGNLAYDIPDTGGYGSSAYYLDERSTDCIVENNVSYDIQRPAHNHMAHGNTLRNNVFVYSGDMRLTFPKSSGFTFSKNVLVAEGKITFDNGEAITALENNILYSAANSIINKPMKEYTANSTAKFSVTPGNSMENPSLVSYRDGKIEYRENSITAKMGILPVDVSGAGVRTE